MATTTEQEIEFSKEQALACYIELQEKRDAEFEQLPDFEHRCAHGNYDFFSNVDIELRELEDEAQRNGFILRWTFDGENFEYTIEQMSPEDYAAFLAEDQEEEEDTPIPSWFAVIFRFCTPDQATMVY